MKPLNLLHIGSFSALKIALNGYQRYEVKEPEASKYFKKIILHLISSVENDRFDVWDIWDRIDEEENNRRDVLGETALTVDRIEFLSRQEFKVLKLIAKGFSNQDIADHLSISMRTAVNHKQRIAAKLGFGSVKDLPKYALEILK